MPVTRIADVVVPATFTDYIVQNTMAKTALIESGVVVNNGAIEAQLRAGSDLFTIPSWADLQGEPNLVSDDPTEFSTPQKVSALRQRVRKAFLHNSWSAMNLASELSGSNPLDLLQARLTAYWTRQVQARLVATLQGIMAANIANNAGDMRVDISGAAGAAGAASAFSDDAFIDAAATLGDSMNDVVAVFVHSSIYARLLKLNRIDLMPVVNLSTLVPFYRGAAVFVDDGMPVSGGIYVTALLGRNAFAYAISPPRVAEGTEIENLPSAGMGGGQHILHSRINTAIHPAGFDWIEGSLPEASPSLADLRQAAHWARVVERKASPIAFLLTK